MTIYTLSTQYRTHFNETKWLELQFVGLQGLKDAMDVARSVIKGHNNYYHAYITGVSIYRTVVIGNGWARY